MAIAKPVLITAAVLALHWLVFQEPVLAIIVLLVATGPITAVLIKISDCGDFNDNLTASVDEHGQRHTGLSSADEWDSSWLRGDDRSDMSLRHEPINDYYSGLSEWETNTLSEWETNTI